MGAVLVGVALSVSTAGSVHAMSGGTQLPQRGAAPWLATLAVKGDAPLLQRARYELLPSPVDPDNVALSSAAYDMAEIRLSAPVRGVEPLPVAHHRPLPGTPVSLFSHGTTAAPDRSQPGKEIRGDVLRRGDLTVRTHAQCAAQTPAVVDKASVLCARDISDGGTTMCFGDSGSPLVIWGRRGPEPAGVFSFAGETAGKVCGQAADAAFADVPALLAGVK
ncbi:peptidase S1 and S6 chymotrypsin/Hap [Streptomyces platensis subsp. clarensis]|nr:peptidase S1 and S6 chymotrypsin/Hap [Streptomyces platensis subsp. clarensis]